jgi:CheY-like chemotaxis protein
MNAPSLGYADPRHAQTGSGETAATILLVEDEPTIRGMAGMYLERNGYCVIPAADGVEAMTLWEKHEKEIDLVLTDLMMPGDVNGQQLVQRLRVDRPNVKAIFMSGYTSDLLDEKTFLGRNANFLPKPYRLNRLAEMVQDCLGRQKGA